MARLNNLLPVKSQQTSKKSAPVWVVPSPSFTQRIITQIFEDQTSQTPDAIAVEYESERLTYEELNLRANQFGHYLRRQGIGPEAIVGVCTKRSPRMVVMILGILKAGGVYVPLDASCPAARLQYMVQDSAVQIVITEKQTQALIMTGSVKQICFEREADEISSESKENPGIKVLPENLAYVIYTSGSTGKPKGVGVSHKGLSNYLEWGLGAYLRETAEKSPVHSPLSFDLTVSSLYLPLVSGHGVRLIAEGKEIEGLEKILIGKEDWGLVKLTPSHLRVLSQTLGESATITGRGSFVIGGEALRWGDLNYWQQHGPELRLLNEYGPTETVVGCCVYEVEDATKEEGSSGVPIGRPIPNAHIYILDGEMKRLPAGEKGEIYIGGIGLARGYVNRPDLTADRFIPNPFSEPGGERMYRTGDIGLYRPDGIIEYAGRIDEQVKVRGYRIELGEIETILEQHPAIKQAIAIVREDVPGDRRLVAYVMKHPETRAGTIEFAEYLASKLPEYMVPSLVFMETFPLTTNGKVDRQALPAPVTERLALEQVYVAPQTKAEKLLSTIWAEVLQLDQVGTQDNFFKLGGNSLHAGQIISRVDRTSHVRLPLRSFFEKPVLAYLARYFESLRRDVSHKDFPSIGAIPRGKEIPLGLSQERVWFVERFDSSSIAYHSQATLNISGPLDVPALTHSLNEIVKRHEIFRTTFEERNGHPIQVVHDPFPAALKIIDLQHIEKERLESVTREHIHQELAKPFDVSQLPLVQWTLFSFNINEHLLLHVEHHFVHDGWSFNVFIGELLEIYKAHVSGLPFPLSPPRFQFADFAVWQREYAHSNDVQMQLAYWKNKLAGSVPINEFPTDRPRGQIQTYRGGLFRFHLPADITDKLHVFSDQQDASLFVIMMSAFFTLTYQYSRQADFCVGTSVANRQRPETEGLIGMLVNNVTLRAQIRPDQSFRNLLTEVRQLTLEAYENQDVAFHNVVQSLNIKRDIRVNPLFQTMFNFHNSPLSVPEIPELKFNLQEAISNGSAKFDLGVVVVPASAQRLRLNPSWSKNTIKLLWEYNADLFEKSTVQRIIEHYQQVLRTMMADPEQKIAEICMLTDLERQQILVDWNQTAIGDKDDANDARNKCFYRLIEMQAEKSPEAVALVFGNQQLSYQDLNCQANRLARHMRYLGISPEKKVAICVERSLEMMVAVLATMKAGGAYIPMDPGYPIERLHYMLEDSGAALVLTQSHLQEIFGESKHAFLMVNLDEAGSSWAERAGTNLEDIGVSPENLAYVIYTSGSTGRPKGVQIPHRAVTNFLLSIRDSLEVSGKDIFLAATTLSFDIAGLELYLPLITGGRVIILDRASSVDGSMLLEALQGATIMPATPASWQLLLEAGWSGIPKVRVLCGGEALNHGLAKKLTQRSDSVWNLYGPTETTIYSCTEKLESETDKIFIGRPIANTQIYLLNEGMEPVPIGVQGSLYIGGEGVARGYLNRPELTAERFVPDPSGVDAGTRIYKTGDIARWHVDGKIEFLGRDDDQVKIRGYRIEPGEIESRLREYPGIAEAAVVVREDHLCEKHLVAYYSGTLSDTSNISLSQLRKHLAAKVPEYMVPTVYVHVESMPRTPNGKLDRKTLPQPEGIGDVQHKYEAPQGEIEGSLASIWADVLKRGQIGRHDNFFELGGHSLLAMRIAARTSSIFNVEVPLRLVFEKPTVRAFGETVHELTLSNHVRIHKQISRISREGDLPLSFNQEGRLLIEWWAEMRSASINLFQFFMVFSFGAEFKLAPMEQALGFLISRYEILRTSFSDPKKMSFSQLPEEIKAQLLRIKSGKLMTPQDMHNFVNRLLFGTSIFQQTIHAEAALSITEINFGSFTPEDRDAELLRIATHAIETPFDYEKNPLMRALLLRKSSAEQVLLIVMPHLLGDGWAIELFRRELTTLYDAFAHGVSVRLPEVSVQSVDFAAWQREQLQGAYLEELVSYWRNRWSEFSLLNVNDLPFVKPLPEAPCHMVETAWHILDRSLSERMRLLLREKNITLYMLWLAALNILFFQYTLKERIGVWGHFANRIQPETENLMGWLANGHILGAQLNAEQDCESLLTHVREVVLEAHSYQEVPMALLWSHFMQDLENNPGAARSPIQPHVSFITDIRTGPQFDAFINEAKFPYRIGRLALKMVVIDNLEDIRIVIQYSSDRFACESIEQMMKDWQQVVQKIINKPSARLLEFLPLQEPQNPTDLLLAQ